MFKVIVQVKDNNLNTRWCKSCHPMFSGCKFFDKCKTLVFLWDLFIWCQKFFFIKYKNDIGQKATVGFHNQSIPIYGQNFRRLVPFQKHQESKTCWHRLGRSWRQQNERLGDPEIQPLEFLAQFQFHFISKTIALI